MKSLLFARLTNYLLLGFVVTCGLASRASAQDLTVSGNLSATGTLDIDGNQASFGTEGSNQGYFLAYTAGNPSTINLTATSAGANWIWSQGAGGTLKTQLKLTNTNTLSLFNPNSGVASIFLNPAGASNFVGNITINGVPVLTTSGNGSSLTNLNASAITSGTIPASRLYTTISGYGITDAQPLSTTLSSLASLTTTAFGRSLLTQADASAARTTLGLGTLATQSGTFSGTSSGVNTGDQTSVSGNAGTATALQTARTINGVSFDGTADITVPAAADTLTGSTLPALSGANLTSLNAAQLATGIIPAARLPSTVLQQDATSGNVGIGTSAPAAKLDVVGDVKVQGSLTVGGISVATVNQLSSYATTTQLATYQTAAGSGAGLTNLNASALTTGTIPASVLPSDVTHLGQTIELNTDETTGNLSWARVDKTSSTLADLATRDFADLQNKPATLAGYGITDAVVKTAGGDVVVTGTTTLQGNVTVNGMVTKLRVAKQGDIDMGNFTSSP